MINKAASLYITYITLSYIGLKMFVINKEIYGFLINPQNFNSVETAVNVFNQFKIDALSMYICKDISIITNVLNVMGNL